MTFATATPQPDATPPEGGTGGDSDAKDLHRDVHLSKAFRPRGVRAEVARRQRFSALVPVLRLPTFFTVGIAVTLATVLAGVVSRLLSVSFWPVAAGAIVLAVLGWLWFQTTRALPKLPAGVAYAIADEVDDAYRLRLTANPRQAHVVLGTPLSDDPFEPRIFPLPLALPTPAWPAITAYVVLTIVASLVWMYLRSRFVGAVGKLVMGPWDYWAIMCVALVPFAWTWPTYLRITPGRLEVLRYRFLGMGSPTITTIDLRDARVLIDLGGGTILIGAGGDQRRIILPDYGPRWADIARAVLESARYQGDHAQALPKDALVG